MHCGLACAVTLLTFAPAEAGAPPSLSATATPTAVEAPLYVTFAAGVPGRYTPVGRFSIYRKVAGFDPRPLGTLYDPMYFTGGYAIHGNPSVPPDPASHGCVRVPTWVAAQLCRTNPCDATVFVY